MGHAIFKLPVWPHIYHVCHRGNTCCFYQTPEVTFTLHNKRRYVYLFMCLLPMAGQMSGPIKTKLGIGTHVVPGSVLVKVKVIYLCVRYKEFMPATPDE